MNIGLSYLTQIRGSDDSGQIVGSSDKEMQPDTPTTVGGWVAMQFNQAIAAIAGGYHKQHNGDDTHGAITAASCASAAGYAEHGRAANAGDSTSVPYDPANFTASGSMTWSPTAGEQVTYAYTMLGHLMTLFITVAGVTGGVASTTLKIAIPAGFRAAQQTYGTCVISDGGGGIQIGQWFVLAAATTVSIQLAPVGNFAIGGIPGADTAVHGTCQFEVQ